MDSDDYRWDNGNVVKAKGTCDDDQFFNNVCDKAPSIYGKFSGCSGATFHFWKVKAHEGGSRNFP